MTMNLLVGMQRQSLQLSKQFIGMAPLRLTLVKPRVLPGVPFCAVQVVVTHRAFELVQADGSEVHGAVQSR